MRKKFVSPGFTIIETLVVLSLIAIATAIVLPGLGGAANRRDLEMVAQNLVSDIRLAQQLNINSGDMDDRNATVRFSAKNGQQYYFITHGNSQIKRVYLPKTVNWPLRNNPNPIRFGVTGSPLTFDGTNSSQTIRLESSGCNPLFIRIAPVTGRIRVTNVANAGNE